MNHLIHREADENRASNTWEDHGINEADPIDRRGFLSCMAWVGTGVLWTMSGGILQSQTLGSIGSRKLAATGGDFSFVQISDSHIGFSKEANPEVVSTLEAAVQKINAMSPTPAFMLHTGDLSHLSKAEEFDTLEKVLQGARPKEIFYVPGEHDVLTDNGKQYRERFGKNSQGDGWYSFDHSGAHFVGLVNVLNLRAGGMGALGQAQLDWLKNDLAGLSSSTPLVVFAHIPLWSIYPEWGWGTEDSAQALALMKRFGSVTVLNGHIHQTMQKVEGNITFHTAMSTAFVQPKPGGAASPGPMKVPAGQLRLLLGIASVHYTEHPSGLAIVDSPLQEGASPQSNDAATTQVKIDNFAFSPQALSVAAGTTVLWKNGDDLPHNIVSRDKTFPNSPVLDTDQQYSYKFDKAGSYAYFCGIHPHMTGTVIVH